MSQSSREQTALKLAFEPNDYLCTWHIPKEDREFVDVQGLLTLRSGKSPWGNIYGELPIQLDEAQPSQISASFPQYVDLDVLTGRLANGANFAITDAQITYWFQDQGYVSGSAAVVTLADIPSEERVRFSSIEFQVEGFDAIAGVAPLKRMTSPNRPDAQHLEGTWSAEGNPESSQKWADDNAELRLEYDAAVRTLDPYSYRMGFSPVVRIEISQPLTIQQWIKHWIEPIRHIVSISTGRVQDVTYLGTRAPFSEQSMLRGQVFGVSISQQPYEARHDRVKDARSALMLKTDEISFLALARAWQLLEADRHPLIETYGAMLTARDQHPRSRFLLLIQAIEGLYGYENKEKYDDRKRRHDDQRSALMKSVEGLLDAEAERFLKRNLRRDPPASLEDSLDAVISDLPTNLMPDLDTTTLARSVREEESMVGSTVGALRVVRNNLAHGLRGYDPHDLHEVVQILEHIVRAHALRLLGCPEPVLERSLKKNEDPSMFSR